MQRLRTLTTLLVVALVLAACGGSDADLGETAIDGVDEVANDSSPAAPSRGDVIPLECFDSEEAFIECEEDGVVPDDCFDDEGFLLDECYPDEPDTPSGGAGVEPADPSESAVSLAFDPNIDAFGFFNYGDDPGVVNLTPVEMQRMFGDEICANLVDGCTLTPPARHWMEQMNQAMSGGHCEGMAVLASLFYFDYSSPSEFGADVTAELEFEGNELLQREIAYWFVTQATRPGNSLVVNESPRAVVDALVEAFEADQAAEHWWAMGIYNPDIAADLYEGDASTQTLELVAIGPRLVEQEQSFADASRGSLGSEAIAAPGTAGIEIWLEGDSNLLITAPDGRRIGYLPDGTFVDEIEGASSNPLKFIVDVWENDDEPIYRLPPDLAEFTITVDGAPLTESAASDVVVIGPGFDMVVEELILGPGEQDLIEIAIEDGDFFVLNYRSEYNDSPDIWFGLVTEEADYEFITRAADIEAGGSFNVALDFANGDFILNTFDQQEYGIYELLVLRIDDEGEHVFGHDDIELLPDDTMYANFLEWEGDGSVMYLDFDYESDGTIDDTIALEDEADVFYDE